MDPNALHKLWLLVAAVGMLTTSAAFAQEDTPEQEGDRPVVERPVLDRIAKSELADDVAALDEIEIAREIDTLPHEIEPQPDDPDLADTALVFTNLSRRTSFVRCIAFNQNGEPVGRTRTVIPPLGLRYVLASDMSEGVDFVGQVQCGPHGMVVGSVIFIGPAVTDLPVRNGRVGKSRIRFPLVAHY